MAATGHPHVGELTRHQRAVGDIVGADEFVHVVAGLVHRMLIHPPGAQRHDIILLDLRAYVLAREHAVAGNATRLAHTDKWAAARQEAVLETRDTRLEQVEH